MSKSSPPAGYVDMTRAVYVTGRNRNMIAAAAAAGEIPGAFQDIKGKTPWYFLERGLRQWRGLEQAS